MTSESDPQPTEVSVSEVNSQIEKAASLNDPNVYCQVEWPSKKLEQANIIVIDVSNPLS